MKKQTKKTLFIERDRDDRHVDIRLMRIGRHLKVTNHTIPLCRLNDLGMALVHEQLADAFYIEQSELILSEVDDVRFDMLPSKLEGLLEEEGYRCNSIKTL